MERAFRVLETTRHRARSPELLSRFRISRISGGGRSSMVDERERERENLRVTWVLKRKTKEECLFVEESGQVLLIRQMSYV